MKCDIRYRCAACGSQFNAHELHPDHRDDTHCPNCGSLRLEHIIERREGVLGFFVEYHKA